MFASIDTTIALSAIQSFPHMKYSYILISCVNFFCAFEDAHVKFSQTFQNYGAAVINWMTDFCLFSNHTLFFVKWLLFWWSLQMCHHLLQIFFGMLITLAPSQNWKLSDCFGPMMTIDHFHNNMGTCRFLYKPTYMSISRWFEYSWSYQLSKLKKS